mgnify:CR=1 FL=1
MACVTVPVVTAVAVEAIRGLVKKYEAKKEVPEIRFSRKLKWFSNLLFGGSALLLLEHVWHGEIVPWYPFLTGASNAEDAQTMLHEMSTVGVAMTGVVALAWLGMLAFHAAAKRQAKVALEK